MNVYVGIRLPSAYQEVEWIGGTNTTNTLEMYIDTGVVASETTGAWTSMLHTGTRNDVQWFTNQFNSNTVRRGMTTYPSGCWCPQRQSWHQTNVAYNTNQWYDIKLNWNNNKETQIDGTNIYSLGTGTISYTGTVRIGNITYTGYGWKCKYFKISDGTTLVRDMIPCYRKSDSVIGMYDLVNNQFYTNAGSGTFSKGSDVSDGLHMMELKNAYIGEVWTPGSNTMAYFPLENDTSDHSGNGVTLSGIGTKQTLGYQFSADALFNKSNVSFVGGWFKMGSIGSSGMVSIFFWLKNSIVYYAQHTNSVYKNKITLFTSLSPSYNNVKVDGPITSGWHYMAYSNIDGKTYICLDGTSQLIYNGVGVNQGDDFYLFQLLSGGTGNTTFSNIIAESVGWTEQQMTDYYNNTKSNYGL